MPAPSSATPGPRDSTGSAAPSAPAASATYADAPAPVDAPPDLVSRLRASGCVFAEEEAALLVSAADAPAELARLAQLRIDGLPLELVLGWAEFSGMRLAVRPGVFVPRRRSEFLVECALGLAGPGAVVVDLCCGTGALGLALARALGPVELHAADLDPAAVDCARLNLAPVGGRVHRGDLYAALPRDLRGRIDVLTANVPYVPTEEVRLLPAEAREHEPRSALDGGGDGLDVLRQVSAEAVRWLAPGGCLLSEISGRQSAEAVRIFTADGLSAQVIEDEERYATVIVGQRPRG